MHEPPRHAYPSTEKKVMERNRGYSVKVNDAKRDAQHNGNSSISSPKHTHEVMVLEFVRNGEALHNMNGRVQVCKKGCLYCMMPLDIHQFLHCSDDFELYSVSFAEKYIPKRAEEFFSHIRSSLYAILEGESYDIVDHEYLFLLREYEKEQRLEDIAVGGAIAKIFCEFLRNLQQETLDNDDLPKNNYVLQKPLFYIRNNFRKKITLTDITKDSEISKSHFCRSFRNSMGITVGRYILNMRLEYAMNLLRTTNMNVSEVCYESGLSSLSYFTKKFMERYGTTPGQARGK